MAKQGLIKLLAFETATISTGFTTNCNVLVQENWGNPTIEQVADATVKQTAPLVASGTQPKLEYIMIKSGKLAVIRSIITPPNPSVPTLVSIEYLSIHGGKASAISFTAPVTDETHIRAIGDQAMQDFHFTN